MNDVLQRFMRQATQDDYVRVRPSASSQDDVEHVARRGGADHRPAGALAVAVAAAILGMVLVAAAVSFRSSAESRNSTQAALTERVRDLTSEVRGLQEQVSAQGATVDELRRDLVDSDADAARTAELGILAKDGGTAQVSGPGLVVTIDDAPNAEADSLNRGLDRDLQDIVNALWRMGAQGVAVNGQRLTQTSAIRGAGDAILVNYQPLTRPYVVTAVGTSSSGEGATDLEALLDLLSKDYGLLSQVATGDVALPAGETHGSRFARTLPRTSTPEGVSSP